MLKGIANLEHHIKTLEYYGIPYVVALNKFDHDTDNELQAFDNWAKKNNVNYALSEVYTKGGLGGLSLAEKVVDIAKEDRTPRYTYMLDQTIVEKIKNIAKIVYGAKDVLYTPEAEKQIEELEKSNYRTFYICMAKTPLSLSDNPKLVGEPKDFVITVREIRVSAGAKFLVCLTGDVMTMPGLPKVPLANKIDLDKNGKIINLS